MNKHAGANCPVGHSYVASIGPKTIADENAEQIERVIAVNRLNVEVSKVGYTGKVVTLSGKDAKRCKTILERCGWTVEVDSGGGRG